MYEDRTQDVIVAEMLEDFGTNVRTDEGSLAYNACVKTAAELEDAYTDMSELDMNALADTMDIIHLIRYGAERGIEYKEATAAIVKAVFLQAMSIGDRLTCQDYTYTITEEVEGEENTYLMQCDEEGVDPNATIGPLDPVDYIDGYEGGAITEVVILGTDDEDEEVFRNRIIDSFSATAFGGNKADYRLYVDAQQGVGGCKPKRREPGSEWIDIYVISSDMTPASSELISELQDLIDPETSHGEGDGKAPICHKVRVMAAGSETIDVEATLTLDTGYTPEVIQPQALEKIGNYITQLGMEWEESNQNEITVRLARIEAILIGIEGVIDVTSLEINGAESNVSVTWTDVPVIGTVTIS
jgi:uncharacterized phage protein gp47/JayE